MDQEDFNGFASYLVKELILGNRTIEQYLRVYKNFNPDMISQEYIHDFVLQYHNTTIIRSFVKHYIYYRGVTGITLPKSPKGKKDQKIIRSITPDEFRIVREYMYSSSFKHGLLLDMIYQGAMRRVEILTISLGSFFWNEWLNNTSDFCKLVITGKGKKQRVVLINPETTESILNRYIEKYKLMDMDSIKEFLVNNRNVLLFTRNNNQPFGERDVYNTIKKLSFKALGRDIRPHELRHARATELEMRGIPIRDIRNYLGHTKLTTTEIYLHKTGEQSTETIKEALRQ
jgi:site-specific recombinase XerD